MLQSRHLYTICTILVVNIKGTLVFYVANTTVCLLYHGISAKLKYNFQTMVKHVNKQMVDFAELHRRMFLSTHQLGVVLIV